MNMKYLSVVLFSDFFHQSFIYFFVWFLGFFFFSMTHGMWDLSSPTRDQTCAPCNGTVES